jgi:hypothetical protein
MGASVARGTAWLAKNVKRKCLKPAFEWQARRCNGYSSKHGSYVNRASVRIYCYFETAETSGDVERGIPTGVVDAV